MKKLNNQGESQKCCNYEQSGFVDCDSEIKASEMSRLSEVFVPGSSDSRSSARITPGTLSSPNHSAITNSKSLNFIGMDVSAVISTWGLSSKGVIPHPSWEMIYIHCESSVNFGDFLPTNGDLLHRINNHNSLVREDDFGMYENQIEQGAEPQTPSQTGQTTLKAVIQDIYVGKRANCKIGGKSEKIATSGSKVFDIAHKGIISRRDERAA